MGVGPPAGLRKRPGRWISAGIGVCAAVLLLAGCGPQTRACSAVGASPSGVLVDLRGVQGTGPFTAQVCVVGKCAVASSETPNAAQVFVANPALRTIKPTVVTIVVRDAAGVVVVPTVRRTITADMSRPNGPGCEPTGFYANATATVVAPAPSSSATTSR